MPSSRSWTDRGLIVTVVAAMVLALLPAAPASADPIRFLRIDGIDPVVTVGQVLEVSIVDTDADGDPNESNDLLFSIPTTWSIVPGSLLSSATAATPAATLVESDSLEGLFYGTVGANERVRADRYEIGVPSPDTFSTTAGQTIVSFQVVVGEIFQDDATGAPTTEPVYGTEFEVADVSGGLNAFVRSTVAEDRADFSPDGLFAQPYDPIPLSITDGRDPGVTTTLSTTRVAVTLPTSWGIDFTGVVGTTTDNGDGTETVTIDTSAVAGATAPGDPILEVLLSADGDPAGPDGLTPDVVTFELWRNDTDPDPYQTAVFAVSTAPVSFAATLSPAVTEIGSTVRVTVTDPRPGGSPSLAIGALDLLVGTEFEAVTSADVSLNNALDASVVADGPQGYRIQAADLATHPTIETTNGGGEVIATIDLRVLDDPAVLGTGLVRVAPVLAPPSPVTPVDVSTQIVAPVAGAWTLTGGGFNVSGPSPFIQVSADGADGQPAVLEYDNDWRWNGTTNDGPGATITPAITMERVATAPGDVTVPWDLSGFHAYAAVSVALTAFQTDGITETTQVLYAPPTRSCCISPSNGFAEVGEVTFGGLQPGDSYGFRITGGNGDANSRVLGTLVVGPAAPVAPEIAVFAAARDLEPEAGEFPTMDVLGRLVGQPSTPYLIEFAGSVTGSTTCDVTVPVGVAVPVVTDAGGIVDFGASFTTADLAGGVLPDRIKVVAATQQVVVEVSAGVYDAQDVARFDPTTGFAGSNCAYAGFGNDAWTSALELPRTDTTAAVASETTAIDLGTSDVIQEPGGARWYKFPVRPNARATIDLTGLPEDYDLAVFTDIDQEYVDITTADADDAINRLGAEFAPSAYSPSAYSPSAYSPSAYSPSAYSPSAYSPSAYSDTVYAPSAYSPSAYSPSAYSPSAYSPSAYSPSAYSPSAYSSDTFSTDDFSADAFAPSAYSPDASSPSAYSPSAYSPSAYSPSAYSPSAYSAAQVQALVTVSANPGTADELSVVNTWNNDTFFYVRVLAKPEVASVDDYRIDVTLEGASCVDVSRTAPGPRPESGPPPPLPPIEPIAALATNPTPKSVIVWDSSRLGGDTGLVSDKLGLLAAHQAVDGVVVDLAMHARVQRYQAQADAEPQCVYAANLVAEAVKDVIDTARPGNQDLRHVVVVGDDSVVPFFRYPDTALLGPESDYVPPVDPQSRSDASLRQNYILGQDQYGAETVLSLGGMQVPVPQLAVGRLVETPGEIIGMIDQFLGQSTIEPDSTLVTGYDFMEDAAQAIKAEFVAGTTDPSVNDELIAPAGQAPGDPDAWTASDLEAAWLDQPAADKHDLIYLAGHFSANSALAADYQTQLLTGAVAQSGVDLAGTLIFSNGCHSGYNIVDGEAIANLTDELDWAQAMARERATFIGGTGYQYGDTDLVEYSERLYAGFARELRRGQDGEVVAVGEALVRAKREYLASTPDPRGLHRKSLLIATVFGLPMTGVDMPGDRFVDTPSGGVDPSPVAAKPGSVLRLEVETVSISTGLASPDREQTVTLDILDDDGQPVDNVEASYLTAPSGRTTVQPNEPILPLYSEDVTATDTAGDPTSLRGVGFRGGTYRDEGGVIPLSSAAGTELRGVHVPFASEVFFPMRVATANYYDALPGGTERTRLLVTPVQHRVDQVGDPTATRRVFGDLDLALFYSNNTETYTGTDEFGETFARTPALAAPPQIAGVRFSRVAAGGDGVEDDVLVEVGVVGDPAAGMQQVWVTTTSGPDASGVGEWVPVDLARRPGDSRLWRAVLPGAAAPGAPALDVIAHAVNGVGLVSTDDNFGRYYRTGGDGVLAPGEEPPTPVATTLTVDAPSAVTAGADVEVTVSLTSPGGPIAGAPVLVLFGSGGRTVTTGLDGTVSGSFRVDTAGATSITASYRGDAEALLAPATASTTVEVDPAPTTLVLDAGPAGGIGATVVAAGGRRVPEVTVLFDVDADGEADVAAITDNTGRALLPSASIPVDALGRYLTLQVAASFGGTATLLPSDAVIGLLDGVELSPPVVEVGGVVAVSSTTGPDVTGDAVLRLTDTDGNVVDAPLGLAGGAISGTVSGLPVGVYEGTVAILDPSSGELVSSVSPSSMLVVYDPSGGSVNGAGWIVPTTGDVLPGFVGTNDDKAHFGFNVRYRNGRTELPEGTARFRYRVGDLRLDASSFAWLAVTNPTGALFQGRADVTFPDGAGGTTTEVRPFIMDVRDDDDRGDEFGIKIYPAAAYDPDVEFDDLSSYSPEWRVARNVIGDGNVNVKTK